MTIKNKNRTGYKKTKVGWIPNKWKWKHVFECANVLFSNVDKKSVDGEISVKLCNYTDVYYNQKIVNSLPFMLATAKEAEIKKFALYKYDVIITKDSESADDIAVPTLVCEDLNDVICGYHLAIIRANREILLGEFLSSLLQSHHYRHYFSSLANGVTRFGLTTDATLKALIPLPSLKEQKRIAEILSCWDEGIEKLEKLILTKQKHKKALMQKLLNGKKRFKEFVKSKEYSKSNLGLYPADWKLLKIENIAKEVSLRNSSSENAKVLSCTKHDGLVDSQSYFSRQVYSADLSNYKVVKQDNFAYATNHIEEGSIGWQTVCPRGLVSPMYTVFSTEPSVDNYFLFSLLKTNKYIQIYQSRMNASVNRRGSLRWKDFSKIKLALPSLPEQKKIATVLKSCDTEIDLLKEKLEKIKFQKKGLMQKLLTGEIRVKV